jgi:signal transduction histidine kinase
MGLFVVGGAYVINRAMLRELRVARMQSEFVAAVSHEFRTPLTTLRQLAEMLVKGRVSNDERRQLFYDQMLRESERMRSRAGGTDDAPP